MPQQILNKETLSDVSAVAAAAWWFDHLPDALIAKAIAAKEGLELAVELGLQKVVLERSGLPKFETCLPMPPAPP
jgi:hypothetical protein